MMYKSNYSLIEKYSYPSPRYTSYPPVPNWVNPQDIEQEWKKSIITHYNADDGLSIYIHLPFCEELCTYCGCNKRISKKHGVEQPYIQSLLSEWNQIKQILTGQKIKIRDLHLGGGTPTFFTPQHLKYLIEEILSTADYANAQMSFEAHPSSTSLLHLSILKALGFERISIGVQDISPKIMHVINRHQTVDQIADVHQMAQELGYKSINYDLIYGLPFQTLEDIKRTIEFVKQNPPGRIAFYSYAHVPWKSASQSRYNDANIPIGYEKYQLKELGHDMFTSMGYKQIGFDHYALPSDSLYKANIENTLHRNFMGYTDNNSNILIGLGCSSISESPDMFVQNKKSVEEYSLKIGCGESPIAIGHKSSLLQQRVSYHINNLMCYYESIFEEDNEEDSFIKSLAHDSLGVLVQDEIISLDQNKIMVLKTDFLRNTCASIDPEFVPNLVHKYSMGN